MEGEMGSWIRLSSSNWVSGSWYLVAGSTAATAAMGSATSHQALDTLRYLVAG